MLGALLGAGASLIGGFLNSSAQKDANAANAAAAAQNIALQREFAQNGIQWKVKDAAKAGVHPLYALGANTTSFSPVSVGATPVSGMGNALAGMGQDISRAVAAPHGAGAKVGGAMLAQQTASNALDLETKSLQNQLLRAQIVKMTQPGTPPGVPFEHSESSKPEENPAIMAGGYRINPDNSTSPMKAIQDRYGDEGPVNWAAQMYVAARDIEKNIPTPEAMPARLKQLAIESFWHNLNRLRRANPGAGDFTRALGR